MPRASQDTIPVSVRMPRGSVQRIRTATGMPFSVLVRLIMMRMLLNLEAKQASQVNDVSHEVDQAITEENVFGQQS